MQEKGAANNAAYYSCRAKPSCQLESGFRRDFQAVRSSLRSVEVINARTARLSLTSRLISGIGSSALAPIVTSIIQLGSVPLLLHAWGAAKYGDWLLLSSIPSYLAFSGLGFGNSSGSEMTMCVAGGDREGALSTFQSSWALVSVVSLIVSIVAAAVVWWVPWQKALHLGGVNSGQAAWIVLALAGWMLTFQLTSVLESGYRCDGNFAIGSFWFAMQRLLEATGGTIIGVLTGSLLLVSVSYLSLRLAGMLGFWLLLKRLSPWLMLGLDHANVGTIRRLLRPSFGFLAMPLGIAVNIQGFMLIVGIVLGPVAVTAFSTSRTLTRVGIQIINSIGNGFWPEMSSAFGAGNLPLARKLHRCAYQASLILAVCCAALLWFVGPAVYHVWVRRSIALDLPCFHLLLLVSIANSLWFANLFAQMSANRHSRFALTYLVGAVASCVSGYVLTQMLGLFGAATALLLLDVVMCAIVLPMSLKQLHDTPQEFLRAVFGSMPYFGWPLAAIRVWKR